MIQLNTVYKVKDDCCFVKVLNEFSNGYETTAGFYTEGQLEPDPVITDCITFDSEHCTELPVNWHERWVLDDRNFRMMIKEIKFGETPAYVMYDGYKSKEVTL